MTGAQVSLSDYYRQRRLDLANTVNRRRKVYLDTKFWVLLRDGLLNPRKYAKEAELLKLSRQLVASGICVFPISEDVYLEVIRQSDSTTLMATVDLIDELSMGVTTISQQERVQLELLYFLYLQSGHSNLYAPEEMVWTKLSYVMGFHSFTNRHLPSEIDTLIQKSFLDYMWDMSLSDQIKVISDGGGLERLPLPLTAENLNIGKFQHMHEASSFKQMFLNEVAGWIDIYEDMLAEALHHMFVKETDISADWRPNNQDELETKSKMGLLIYNIFRRDKMGLYLPSARISSGLYAAVRWDKKQKFQNHDFHDFRHACAALPYFEFFFTEKRLMHLITQKQLAFDQMFNCRICSKVDQAIGFLEVLPEMID